MANSHAECRNFFFFDLSKKDQFFEFGHIGEIVLFISQCLKIYLIPQAGIKGNHFN